MRQFAYKIILLLLPVLYPQADWGLWLCLLAQDVSPRTSLKISAVYIPHKTQNNHHVAHPAQDCRQANIVANVSGGSCALFGWSFSGASPPMMVGQRLFRKVTQAWMNGSYDRQTGRVLSQGHVYSTMLLRIRTCVCSALTPCSRILSVSHLSSLRYSRREASAARSITKANGVPFSSIDRDWKAKTQAGGEQKDHCRLTLA